MKDVNYYDIAKATLIRLAEENNNVRALSTLIQENVNKQRYLRILVKMIDENAIDDDSIDVRALIDDNERVDVAHRILKFTEAKKGKMVIDRKELSEL